MNTWAAIEYGKVDTVGLCHGVQHGGEQIAEVLGAEARASSTIVCSGINHQTWYIDLRLRGRKIGKDELLAAFERAPGLSRSRRRCASTCCKRFGFYSTESNGHLSEYLPWYRKRPDEIAPLDRHVELDPRRDRRLPPRTAPRRDNWFETDYPKLLEEAGQPLDRADALDRARQPHHRGAGDGPPLSRPLQRQERRADHQPARATRSSKSPGFVDRFGLNMTAGITLPEACAATCMASINVQRMAVHAAVAGDVDLLKLAVLHDPLVGAVCTPEEVWQMVDEMLVAQAEWLPQYAHAIAGARKSGSRAPRSRRATGRARHAQDLHPIWLAASVRNDGGRASKGAA